MLIGLTAMKFISLIQALWDTSIIIFILLEFRVPHQYILQLWDEVSWFK